MKKVNLIMMWLCIALALLFVVLFVFSWISLREFDPVMIMYLVGAILTAKVFWKRYRGVDQSKARGSN